MANTYRSELMGLYVTFALVLAVCILNSITQGHLEVASNNEKALCLSSLTATWVWPKEKHSDMLRAICCVHCLLSFLTFEFSEVQAHKDNFIALEDLTFLEQLNMECNILAKCYIMAEYEQQGPIWKVLSSRGSHCQSCRH